MTSRKDRFMTPLALRIYTHLTARLRRNNHSITYRELAAAVDAHPRSPALHAALARRQQAPERRRAHTQEAQRSPARARSLAGSTRLLAEFGTLAPDRDDPRGARTPVAR
jgi:hypothetical protein